MAKYALHTVIKSDIGYKKQQSFSVLRSNLERKIKEARVGKGEVKKNLGSIKTYKDMFYRK